MRILWTWESIPKYQPYRQKGYKMTKTYKKTINEKCPCCKQWTEKEVEVKMELGLEFIAIRDNNHKVELTCIGHKTQQGQLDGVVLDEFPLFSVEQADVTMQILSKKFHLTGTYITIDSNYMDKIEIHNKRHVIDGTSIDDLLKTSRKMYRQSRFR